jgi:hypothetical protein
MHAHTFFVISPPLSRLHIKLGSTRGPGPKLRILGFCYQGFLTSNSKVEATVHLVQVEFISDRAARAIGDDRGELYAGDRMAAPHHAEAANRLTALYVPQITGGADNPAIIAMRAIRKEVDAVAWNDLAAQKAMAAELDRRHAELCSTRRQQWWCWPRR